MTRNARTALPVNRGWRAEDALPYLLARASHAVTAEFHGEVKQAGMTILEWRVLASLADGHARTVGALAEIALALQPTLTKLLDRLAHSGQIERHPSASDRRQSLISITPMGQARIMPLLARSRAHERRVLAWLEPEKASLLKGSLKNLIYPKP